MITNFDEKHCHKWALLLRERKGKLEKASEAINTGDFENARKMISEVFFGVSAGKQADPGMAGSLLYHMAMVSKMASETSFLLEEFQMKTAGNNNQIWQLYGDFVSDVTKLYTEGMSLEMNSRDIAQRPLSTDDKVALFRALAEKTRALENGVRNHNSDATELASLFSEWVNHIVEMRLRQEYETIKGLFVSAEIAQTFGIRQLQNAMSRVQDKFGEATVKIALDVTLKVGMRREKLQTVMLADHFIDYKMDIAKLEGSMRFFNCPIAGSHRYIAERTGLTEEIASLFCKHFCYAHAKAMLEAVLPFTFTLKQPRRIAIHGECEFSMNLGHSPGVKVSGEFVPLVVSWNLTRKCNLKCSHCYINSTTEELRNELSTKEAKELIDQICQVSRPLLILSGGEPLLRKDVLELVKYGSKKGLRMGLGSNGSLIDETMAKNLKDAEIKTVSISLDSVTPQKHDDFRGVAGSWQKAINAIKALTENDVLVQVNTTVTQHNLHEIDQIMSLSEEVGVENFHLFFLVPTGRGARIADISPAMYERMIRTTFAKTAKHKLNVRPSCAPQFMRIAKDMGLDMRQWIRGCIAGLYYCRIYPNGDVTPCPYLPVKLGNIREESFSHIWHNSGVFKNLRNFNTLKGKCGLCDYRSLCGGCRARAYGLSSDFIDFCGDLHEPTELRGDYLAEDPWCVYSPRKNTENQFKRVS
jgi:radical SAM protein with 4Fe4S-binding SPASM domain